MESRINAIVAAAALLSSSAAQGMSRDPGPPDQRRSAPGEFDRIAIAGPFVVKIRTGKATSVSLSGPRTMLDDIELVVHDGQLVVGWQEGASWSRNGDQGVNIDITMPVLRGVTNVGAGSIAVDRIKADHFLATLLSAGGVTIGSMDVGYLKAELAGAGTLELEEMEAKDLDVDLVGSGGMRAAGRADTANLRLASSGSFDNPNFAIRNASISSGGSGSVVTTVTSKADIKTAGSGMIVVTGGAKCSISRAGSGDVRCS
jgi:putative autotransporter adhesin-like protein